MDNILSGIFSPSQQPDQTPTPEQIRAAYGYANTLKSQGLNPPQPIKSWTQGVNQMLQALLGNYAGNRADALQRQNNTAQKGAIPLTAMPPSTAPYMPQQPTTNAPPSTYSNNIPYLGAPFSAGGGQ